ncbi:MAG: hypothetical protein M1497_00765, partial [Nitrospirae bacterium]|nr:hypothetical protein [Nitrospirota bacterium]
VGVSNRFRVRLTRGAETLDDEWILAAVTRVTLTSSADFAFFFPTFRQGPVPTSGALLNISRGSRQNRPELNLSYVLPETPQRCGIDLDAYPIFRTLIRMPTFDAVVEA